MSESLESDIAQQERTLRAIEAEEQAGRSLVSPERKRSLQEAHQSMKQHRQELEAEQQFKAMLPDVERRASYYRDKLTRLREDINKPGGRELYGYFHDKMINLRDRFEDISKTIPADSRVRKWTDAAEQRIRDTFLRILQAEEKPVAPSSVRQLHSQVKAAYAEVSHQLTLDQRRDFRVRIAQLSALVRHSEDAQWRRLFVAHDRRAIRSRTSGIYFKSPTFVRAAASLALARAADAAVAIGKSLKLKG